MNVVILVNQYSASASELFTGIVRDNCDKCVVVGTQTYGKGVVQSLRSFPDGSGIKMTTNEYFTTGQYTINGVGIIPDVKVDDYQYTGTLDKEKDTQFKKAVEILKDGDVAKFRNEKRQDVEGYKKANTNTISE
jgi:carboxyl-terminal processing protease